MSAGLALPRWSLREYFATLFHEHAPHPPQLVRAALAHDGLAAGSHAPARAFLAKGKARALDAINTIVDSMLYAKATFHTPAAAEARTPLPSIGSSVPSLDTSEQATGHKRYPPPRRRPHREPRPTSPPPSPEPGRNPRDEGGMPSTSKAARVTTQPYGPGTASVGQPWQRGHNISASALPSVHLDPRWATRGQHIIELAANQQWDEALPALSQLYTGLERDGHLEPLKAAGTAAVSIRTVAHMPLTADCLLLLRYLLTTALHTLRRSYVASVRSKSSRAKLDQVQQNIQSVLTWLVKHPPLLSLISFHNPRLSSAAKYGIMSLDAPAQTAKIIVKALIKEKRVDAVPGVYQVFILALLSSSAVDSAYDLFCDAMERSIPVRETVARKLARLLSFHHRDDLADDVFDKLYKQLDSNGISELSTESLKSLAAHHARIGRADLVEEDLSVLAQHQEPGLSKWIRRATSELLAEAAAVRGDIDRCDELLSERYDFNWTPGQRAAPGKRPPIYVVNSRRLRARLRAGRLGMAERLLLDMVASGQNLSPRAFQDFMLACTRFEDVLLARRVLDAHEVLELPLTESLLVPLMYVYAHRHDAEGTARVLQFMFDLGLKPPPGAYTALLLAHVDSHQWKEAFSLFQSMQRSTNPLRRPTAMAHYIMLKALVLSGSAVSEVMRFAKTMKRSGIVFSKQAYALLMQSASDAGAMGLAVEVFEAADAEVEGGADEFHFSILINGFLRYKMGLSAKKYFDEMKGRGLQPSHVTYAMLVQQHAQMGTDEDIQKAMRVAMWAASEVDGVAEQGSRYHANFVASLYMPILRAEVNRGESLAAEELVDQMAHASGNAAIRCLTILLDLYRRDGRVQAAMQTWHQLVAIACADEGTTLLQVLQNRVHTVLKKDGSPPVLPRRIRNPSMLCMPLSIILDALSTAGLHDEALAAWDTLKEVGGTFDPDNWNVLVTVYARAGRIENALAIIEHVLRETPPNWDKLRNNPAMRRLIPLPAERLTLLEELIGRRGLAQRPSRRTQNRIYERPGDRTDNHPEEAVSMDEDEEEDEDEYVMDEVEQDSERDSELGDEEQGSEKGGGIESKLSSGRRQRPSASASPQRRQQRTSWQEVESAAEEAEREQTYDRDTKERHTGRDAISVALTRRQTIDTCFWFAHQKKLEVLSEAIEVQQARRDQAAEEAAFNDGDGGDDATHGDGSASGPLLSMADIRQRYPTAARILTRFRTRRQAELRRQEKALAKLAESGDD